MQLSKNSVKTFTRLSSALFLSVISGLHTAQADLTCNLNRSVTGASAVGTLTVNTIGSGLTASNFTAWNITVTTTTPFTLTNLNSAMDLGNSPPSIVSTANSLTITPAALSSLAVGQNSRFYINIGGATGQFYDLENGNMGGPGGGTYSSEVFRYSGSGADQIINSSPPASLNLTCSCSVGGGITSCGTVSAPIDLNFAKQPTTFATEIEIK